jgi:D-glycero-D-manno-heptose 1,7-bisphosphate phosphatase
VNIEQAVFLVGGLGSRLHGLTSERAKPMLDVGGRPFLDYLLDEASRYGIKRALLLCGYRAGDLTPVYQGRAIRGMRIDTVVEASPAGTAGALALAADRLDDDFLLVNGDSLFDFNWLALCPAPGEASASLDRMALAAGVAGTRY